MKDTAIVIPARNEADNIGGLVRTCRQYGDVVVVDDASTDGTGAKARAAGAAVLTHAQRTHIKKATLDGLWHTGLVGYKYIIQMDAGNSHNPAAIPVLLAPLQFNVADMTIGSRFVLGGKYKNPSRRRLLLSLGGSLLVCLATDMPFADLTSGYKAYKGGILWTLACSGVFEHIEARAHGFQFEFTYAWYRRGYRIMEVPITYTRTTSSVNTATVADALSTILRLWRKRHAYT